MGARLSLVDVTFTPMLERATASLVGAGRVHAGHQGVSPGRGSACGGCHRLLTPALKPQPARHLDLYLNPAAVARRTTRVCTCAVRGAGLTWSAGMRPWSSALRECAMRPTTCCTPPAQLRRSLMQQPNACCSLCCSRCMAWSRVCGVLQCAAPITSTGVPRAAPRLKTGVVEQARR
jgi:hypothetical protein